MGGKATEVVGESSGADKKVLSSTNYIPNMTTIISGGEIASAKGIIPDISKVGYPLCCCRLHLMEPPVVSIVKHVKRNP